MVEVANKKKKDKQIPVCLSFFNNIRFGLILFTYISNKVILDICLLIQDTYR